MFIPRILLLEHLPWFAVLILVSLIFLSHFYGLTSSAHFFSEFHFLLLRLDCQWHLGSKTRLDITRLLSSFGPLVDFLMASTLNPKPGVQNSTYFFFSSYASFPYLRVPQICQFALLKPSPFHHTLSVLTAVTLIQALLVVKQNIGAKLSHCSVSRSSVFSQPCFVMPWSSEVFPLPFENVPAP